MGFIIDSLIELTKGEKSITPVETFYHWGHGISRTTCHEEMKTAPSRQSDFRRDKGERGASAP